MLAGGDFTRHDVDPDRTFFGLVAIDKCAYARPRYSQEAQHVATTLLAAIRNTTDPLIALHQLYNVVAFEKPIDQRVAHFLRAPAQCRSLRDR